jgi:ferredoxin-fold anticodon binding domain-containing protein
MTLHEKLKYYEGEEVFWTLSDTLIYIQVGLKQKYSTTQVGIIEEVGEDYIIISTSRVQEIIPFCRVIIRVTPFAS